MLTVNFDSAAGILHILSRFSHAEKTRDDKSLSFCTVCTVLNNIENGPIGE